MTEVVEKAPHVALDAMNATLRRMHKTPPKHHAKPASIESAPDMAIDARSVVAPKRRAKSPSEK
jgi:hypothetical protein